MVCDIFIRTYWKDFPWLVQCLDAIDRRCRGFRDVIVVVPHSSKARLARLLLPDVRVRVEFCRDYRDDYLGQQLTKLTADTVSDAAFICHVDADCIFTRTTFPEDLIIDGRPRIVMRSYESLGRHWPWRRPTESFLGHRISHDFMQQPPFVYPRWLYAMVREHAANLHGTLLDDYVLSNGPRSFSEFNAMGALAWTRHRERFNWVDHDVIDPASESCRWYWSWAGLDDHTRREIQSFAAISGDR